MTEKDEMDKIEDEIRNFNEHLAQGNVRNMTIYGAIGYHHFIAKNETDIEYLVREALLEAITKHIIEPIYIDAEDIDQATMDLEEQLHYIGIEPFLVSSLTESFESNLKRLKRNQEKGENDE